MTTMKTELGALGFAVLLIIVASMISSGTMNAVQAAWTLVPATLVMAFVAFRDSRRAAEKA